MGGADVQGGVVPNASSFGVCGAGGCRGLSGVALTAKPHSAACSRSSSVAAAAPEAGTAEASFVKPGGAAQWAKLASSQAPRLAAEACGWAALSPEAETRRGSLDLSSIYTC